MSNWDKILIRNEKNLFQKFILWIKVRVFGYCIYHDEYFMYQKKYRKNTAYEDDTQNWGYAGKCCQQDEHDYYQELWDDYYSSRL